MDRLGVRDLRNNVAAVLRRAAAGERIVITVDGEPTAQLGPIEPVGEPTLDDMVASGLVTAPARPLGTADALHPGDVPVDIRIDDVLDQLRGL